MVTKKYEIKSCLEDKKISLINTFGAFIWRNLLYHFVMQNMLLWLAIHISLADGTCENLGFEKTTKKIFDHMVTSDETTIHQGLRRI